MFRGKRDLADASDLFRQVAPRLLRDRLHLRNTSRLARGEQRIGAGEDLLRLDVETFHRTDDALRREHLVRAQRHPRHGHAEEIVERGDLRVVGDLGWAADEEVGAEHEILQQRAGQRRGRRSFRRCQWPRALDQMPPAMFIELEEQRMRLAGTRHDLRRVAGVLQRCCTHIKLVLDVVPICEDAVEQRRSGAAKLGKKRVDQDELPIHCGGDQLRE